MPPSCPGRHHEKHSIPKRRINGRECQRPHPPRVGGVFLNEGASNSSIGGPAAGRFATIGIPYPEFFGPFVATVEVLGGLLVISAC